MIFPITDNTFVWSFELANILQHFLPMLCAHATNIKKTLALGQTLLHDNTSTIKITFCKNLIKCL
jgi:hypothetical protein